MKLKWLQHSDLAIDKHPTVTRDEYLSYMTFKSNKRALYTEIFGPIVGLKEEWEELSAYFLGRQEGDGGMTDDTG